MFQQWKRIILAAFLMTVPLAAGPARGQAQHAAAAKTKKKPAKVSAKKVKPGAKTASHHPSGAAVISHRPPAPPPSPKPNPFEVPQPKNLAATPDMVLNSRVRASLMAALSARNEEDILPTTTKGVVTLTGSVKSRELRARAEQVARRVHGVHAVKNQLVVK